jgi:uncharacterized repeat protein (TIGR01451 family)
MYEMYQLNFNLAGLPSNVNPYRTDTSSATYTANDGTVWSTGPGVDVSAQVTTPSGKTVKVYGYWDTDFQYLGQLADYNAGWSQYDKYVPTSAPHWIVRYAPSELGTHSVQISVTDASGTTTSSTYTFNCTAAVSKGFVRPSADGTRFTYDTGDPYIAFAGKAIGAQDLATSGINTVRTWITNSNNNQIYKDGYPQQWKLSNGAVYDNTTAHTGSQCVRDDVTGANAFLALEKVAIRDSAYYQAYAWIKTSSDFSGTAAVQVQVRYTDGTLKTFTGSPVGSNAGWTQSVLNFATALSGKTADCLDFKVVTLSGSAGHVWTDDAGLYECNSDYSIKVNANYLWNPSLELLTPDTLRLPALWRIEKLYQDYQASGVTQQICIFDYKEWDTTAGSLGFYADYFNDNFWDPTSNSYAQEQEVLRYLVARFASYRSMFAFELTNEMNPNWDDQDGAWIASQASYIKSIDPYNHIVTNSYWNSPATGRKEQIANIGVDDEHYYTYDEIKSLALPLWGNLNSGVSTDTNPSDAHSGNNSLKIANGSQSVTVYVKPASSYTFRFWGKAPGTALYGNITQFDQTGKQVASGQIKCSTSTYSQPSTTLTTTATTAYVVLNFTTTGTTWLDDVELVDNTVGHTILFDGGFEANRLGDDEFEWSLYRGLQSKQVMSSGTNPVSRPWIGTEFGLASLNFDWSTYINPTTSSPHDTTGIHIHNTMWASFMANSATMTPGYWWLAYVDNYNLWGVWSGLTTFAKKLPFYTKGTAVSTDPAFGDILTASSNPLVRVIGQESGNSAYLWIDNSQYTWSKVVRGGTNPSAQSSTISIPGFSSGTYKVDWYNTVTGVISNSQSVTVSSGALTLSVSGLTTDTAVIVTPSAAPIAPALTVTISADKTSVPSGGVITYTVSYVNKGNDTANNVKVTLPIPANTTYVSGSASAGGVVTGNSVVWTIPSVPAGGSGQVTAQVKVN